MLLHFQFGPDGELTSPQVPTGPMRQWAETRYLDRAQLEAAFDEIEALERSLQQVAHERDLARLDLGRERRLAQQAGRHTFVQAEAPEPHDASEPHDAKDAAEMIRHYFATREHLSRRRAKMDKGWSADRHAAAQSLLVRAGVLAVNATQPVMLAQTLDEALGKLSTHLIHARSQQPPVMAAARSYEDDE